MRERTREWRCSSCGILLAKVNDSGLTIRRSELQATVTGEFYASVVCYRPGCRTLNVLRITGGEAKGKAVQLHR